MSCGTPLTQAIAAPYVGLLEKPSGTAGLERPWWGSSTEGEIKDFTAIGRTKKGVALLAVSIVLGPIPFLTYLGFVLGLVGVILVILGRQAFGKFHSNLVILSVGIWIVGIIISFLVGAAYGYDVASVISTSNPPGAKVLPLIHAFNALIRGLLVGSAIVGLSQILITYAIQTTAGRLFLFFGYLLSIAMGVVALSIISPRVNSAVWLAISTQDLAPLSQLLTQFQSLSLVQIIPASISALAFSLAYSRIAKGEIPESTTVPAWS